MPKITRALISVSDRTGISDVAARLQRKGIEILSTGGTAKHLTAAGIPVMPIEEITRFPECFSGRVKTMHPLVMGGLLFRRGDAEHEKQAKELGVRPIDLVIVNLYPFEEARGTKTPQEMVELIDVGGPTMLRSAAKNFSSVTVICDPADYGEVMVQIENTGDTTPELRRRLSAKVFTRTAAYDSAIAEELSDGVSRGVILTNRFDMRYGENPHQWGAFYEEYGKQCGWRVLQEEKKMSYLNILDADGAANLVAEFSDPTAACIKHANPSGVACHADITEAFQRSYDADRLSAFGVIVALNRPCTAGIIEKIVEQKIFTEVIIAPSFESDAMELLKKRPKIRAIEYAHPRKDQQYLFRSALGGMLVQEADTRTIGRDELTCVTEKKPTVEQIADLLFAWKVVKHAKSNAIVFAKDRVTVGIGCGQTSRVDSTWIAAKRAGERAKQAVMASDAFFPFPDSVEEAAQHGITAIIQPGGSIRDQEVFAKANALGIAMVTTGVRAFRH